MGRDLGVLRLAGFRRLLLARTASALGTGAAPVALAFAVLGLPDAGPGTLGLVLTARAVPDVVFVLLGGVLADRVSRARLMVGSDVLAGLAQLATAALFITGTAAVPALMLLAALNGLATALFSPALTGLVPQVVPEPRLQAANGLLRLGTNVAHILGTALGGVLVVAIGAGPALLVDGLSFLLSAALLVGIAAPTAIREASTVVEDLRQGWREFVGRQWVWVIVLNAGMINLAWAAAFGVLGPVRAREDYGGAGAWAAVLTAMSVGTVLGVLLAIRLRPRRPMLLATLATFVVAVPMALLATSAPVWAVAAAAFTTGVALDVFAVLWETALQRHVPTEMLSRVSAYDWLGSLVLVPLGLALAGPAATTLGLDGALWAATALVVVPTGLALLSPQVRRLT